MAVLVVYDTSPDKKPLADAVNAIRRQIGAGAAYHLDASEVVPTLAAANSLATDVALANHLKRIYNGGGSGKDAWIGHLADDLLHLAVDATNVIAAADATDQATGDTLATEIKAKFNAHLTQAGKHHNNDVANAVVAADGNGTEGVLRTLVNGIRTAMLAHLGAASAPTTAAPMMRLVAA